MFLIFLLKNRLWRGGSNKYRSTMIVSLGAKIRKKIVYTCKPQFYYIKVGYDGVYISQTC